MLVLSTKPLQKLTGTDRQAGRRTDGQDHVLSQADALTKKSYQVLSVLSRDESADIVKKKTGAIDTDNGS